MYAFMKYTPLLFFGTTLNNDARVGPNQHSAVRYSPSRHNAATAGSSARMKAAHSGAASKLPEYHNIKISEG
jgi:hypothetical protein